MFSHVYVGVADFARAHAFYAPLLELLGQRERFADPDKGWAAWQSPEGGRPLFIVGLPFEAEHRPGNGQMTAFLVPDRGTVARAHKLALALGGRCAGEPGLRPHYHADYFGAYFHDPDGNKLCVVCHDAEVAPAA
ncbi:MAG: VOC family protein [Pelomonas sp.]|nr:VOC family protein [Roseateles sp.]